MNAYWSRTALVLAVLLAIILGGGGPAAAQQPQQKPVPAQPLPPPKPPATSTEQSNLKALTIEPTPPFADPSRRGALLLPFVGGPRLPQGALDAITRRDDTRASPTPDLRAR